MERWDHRLKAEDKQDYFKNLPCFLEKTAQWDIKNMKESVSTSEIQVWSRMKENKEFSVLQKIQRTPPAPHT